MEEAGFGEIGVYIKNRQNTVAQYMAMRPILDLCERSIRKTGACVSWMWWDQEGIDLEGAEREHQRPWTRKRRNLERSDAWGDDGKEMKAGSTTVANLTQ